MVFPVVMYRCESWTVKKAECQRIDAFELWCWRRLLRAGKSRRSWAFGIFPPNVKWGSKYSTFSWSCWKDEMRSSIEQWNWARLGIWSWSWEDPLEKGIATRSSILAWITVTIMKLKLSVPVSCYYWGTKCDIWTSQKILDMASISVLLFFSFPSTFSGEGNGTPLQYSCLENPMDGGVW